MHNKLLRFVSAIVLFATVAVSTVSCSKSKTPNTPRTTPESETEYMEAVNYDTDFIILSSTVSEEGGRHFAEFGGDLGSDVVAAEIFRRDSQLQTKYNITFQIKSTTNWNTELQKAHLSDQLEFHVATPGASNAVYSITNGFVANLDNYPNFDFQKEWWSWEAIEQMSVVGKHLMAIGDINLLAYDSVGVVFFNKVLARQKNLQIDELYELVNSGKWTYEKMMEYVKETTTDSNGDGSIGAGDTFGLIGGSYSALCFTFGGNFRFAQKDEDGVPTLQKDLKNYLSFFQDVVNDHSQPNIIGYENVAEDTKIFDENRLLFSVNMLGMSANFRATGTEYGILPLPKYNVYQDKYYTFPHQSASTTICIPTSNHEYEMTSRVIEDMAYMSRRDVLKYYVENNLFRRNLDGDVDAYNIVLNLLQNINCDIFFSFRAGITDVLRTCMDTHNANVTSYFNRYVDKFDDQLNSIVAGTMKEGV